MDDRSSLLDLKAASDADAGRILSGRIDIWTQAWAGGLCGGGYEAYARIPHSDEAVGHLDSETLATVLSKTIDRMHDSELLYLAFWSGWAWVDDMQLRAPVFSIPGRNYLLYSTHPRRNQTRIALDGVTVQSPNFIWPQDFSWTLATEVDDTSTFVAGSSDLIRALVADEIGASLVDPKQPRPGTVR